jgi:hypothetical protein
MRSTFAFLAALGLAACSTSNTSSTSQEDASIGPDQPLGAACNASLSNACVAAASSCSINQCTSGVCLQFIVDAGGVCAVADAALPFVNSLCVTNSDCDGGLCGYLAVGGCSVTGVCFPPNASSGTLPSPACGCNGLPDPYVATGFTGAPAASPGACVDGGADGGIEAGADGGVDAGIDASDAGDASDASDGAPE